jgi:hypothetical protein
MRFSRGELRVRFARADADKLRFLVAAVPFFVTVLFDEDEVED